MGLVLVSAGQVGKDLGLPLESGVAGRKSQQGVAEGRGWSQLRGYHPAMLALWASCLRPDLLAPHLHLRLQRLLGE